MGQAPTKQEEEPRHKEPFVPGSPVPVHRNSIASAPFRLVLLGSENNGKSTFWKQILSIYGKSLTSWMVKPVKSAMYQNVISSMQTLCKITREQGARDASFKIADDLIPSLKFVLEFNEQIITNEFAQHATNVWRDRGIQTCFENRNRKRGFVIEGGDTLPYLMENINKMTDPNFALTEADAIRSYTRTRGTGEHINHSECKVGDSRLLVVDTDGQKGQRDKWQQTHRFEAVSALVVVASLTSYDEVLIEDESVNAMDDSLELFEQVCALKSFSDTPIVLILNKTDLFKAKLKQTPLSSYFSNYESKSEDPDEAIDFIKKRFEERFMKHRGGKHNKLHIVPMCAVEQNSVQIAVAEITMVVNEKRAHDRRSQHRPSTSNSITKIFSNRDLNHE